MEFALRLANDVNGYPLPIAGAATWQNEQTEDHKQVWVARLSLPVVPPDHIIVPSFCQLDECDAHFQFCLHGGFHDWPLNPVPAGTSPAAASKPASISNQAAEVSCHIDCWHTHSDLEQGVVELRVRCAHAPSSYLLTLSIRVLELGADATPPVPDTSVMVTVPRNISQMNADAAIRARICSPTALVMALSALRRELNWQTAVQACYDPQTKAYGAWPLAINAAAQQGIAAAVECFYDWTDVVRILEAGSPLVCSIRFKQGQLQDAPLPQTGGHLVVLYGIDGGHVLVKDPAANQDSEVSKRYLAEEFSKAWLQRRGAAYIFAVSQ